jgi:4-hydroxy-tetrahydrodipicolinate synthase
MTSSENGHSMREIIGTSAAMVTPFDEKGSINWPVFATHAKGLLNTGMKVVTAFGTTGEGVSISVNVRNELYERLGPLGVAPDQLVECVYGPSSADAGAQIKRSLTAGCAGILLAPPFYFKGVTDEGVFRWYAEVFETVGGICRDVIIYNIPQLTGVSIGPALLGWLRQEFPEAIAGIKDSAGNWEHTTSLLTEHRDLAVLVGHEGHLARAVRHGASGAISGVANIAPALVARLVGGEDDPLIGEILEGLLKLPVVPAIKSAMAIRSGDQGWARVRAPLQTITEPADLDICSRIAAAIGKT